MTPDLGLAALFNNTMYRSVNLGSVMEASEDEKKRLKLVIQKEIQHITPFKKNLFSPSEKLEAAR